MRFLSSVFIIKNFSISAVCMKVMSFLQVFKILFERLLMCLEFVRILAMMFLQSVLTLLFVWHVTLLDAEDSRKPLQLVQPGMSFVLVRIRL